MSQAELDQARKIAFWEMRQAAAKNKERIKQATLIKRSSDEPNAKINEQNSSNNKNIQNKVNHLNSSEKENVKESNNSVSNSINNNNNNKIQGKDTIIRNPRPPTSSKSRPAPVNVNDIAKRANKKHDKKSAFNKTHSKRGKEMQQNKHRVGQVNSHGSNVQDHHDKE